VGSPSGAQLVWRLEWGRHDGAMGQGYMGKTGIPFGDDGGTMPPIVAYDVGGNGVHPAYVAPKWLPSMDAVLQTVRGGGRGQWRCVQGMDVADVQKQVRDLLLFISKHILAPVCLTLGTIDGVRVATPVFHYLVTKPLAGGGAQDATPACMPGKELAVKGVFQIRKGYYYINMGQGLKKNGKRNIVWEAAHRIVCFAFNGPPPAGHEVGHLCGCTNCLAPRHVAWVTKAENVKMRSWHKLVGNGGKVCPEAEYRVRANGP